jgi:[ribosomal protein S5]-alanine N-acetyltransferase
MFMLATERRLLRQVHILDAEPLCRIFCDPEVMQFSDGVQTQEWVRRWVTNCLEEYYREWGFGPYTVVERARREVIGYCGLFFFPDLEGQPEVEIGYRLARASWGQGYATEAAQAVRDFAFESLCLKRLVALIDPHNSASIRVAEKIGMRYEKDVMFEGYTHPDRVYSLSA